MNIKTKKKKILVEKNLVSNVTIKLNGKEARELVNLLNVASFSFDYPVLFMEIINTLEPELEDD